MTYVNETMLRLEAIRAHDIAADRMNYSTGEDRPEAVPYFDDLTDTEQEQVIREWAEINGW